jgi:hypothetical protein
MGVDFFLYRRKRRKMPKSDIALPEIEARFAFTEYPRFLSKLAKGAGIGEVWDNYKQAVSVLSESQLERAFAELEGKQPETTNEGMESLIRRVEKSREAVEEFSDEEPLIKFLLAPMDSGDFDAEACQRIGPRIRMIAENWPELRHGWRGRAFEIVDAMEVAANHSDIVFGISG